MFEALLDSAASAAALDTSQSREAAPFSKFSKSSKSSETSRTAAATGKAYRALKELVRAPYCPLEPRITWSGRTHSPDPPHATADQSGVAFYLSRQPRVAP